MYKVGDKVLCQTSPNLWKEGVINDHALAVGHWWVDMLGECTLVHERDIKPRTSPNELTVVVKIDASAANAELDGLGELITQRVKAAVAAGLAGETADLVRERDALREELAACKRDYADAIAVLRATEAARDERVNDLTWERDEARQKLADANAAAAGSERACEDLRAALLAAEKQRDELRESLDNVTTSLDDYASGMGLLAAAIRKARGEGL
jgi:soluble cytochrome b562